MKESQFKALLKKTAAKAAQPKKLPRSFDPTLEATKGRAEPVDGSEADEIFREMKRREF